MNPHLLTCSCGAPRAGGTIACGGCGASEATAGTAATAYIGGELSPSSREVSGSSSAGSRSAGSRNAADSGQSYPLGAVLGSYRLLQQIGVGGMGRVFVAEHVRLGRKVALKVLRSEFSGNLEAVKRFFAEARSVNCISHENIIEVSDFVENLRGPSFYIMELLQGIDLGALQAREGVLPLPRALRISLQVCSALRATHQAGIIHRDLKPENIFLVDRPGRRDFVKLLDFGVAKLMNATIDQASPATSSVGMVVGTPNYMAPEQALAQPVSHLADIYSLGVILFEMVAGRRPFIAITAREVMVQHLTVTPPRPSQLNPAHEIPSALEELILACLAKEPAERPQSIQEVERRLRAILATLPASGDHMPSRSAAARRRKPMAVVVGMALMLAIAGSVVWARGGDLRFSAARWPGQTRPNGAVAAAPPAFQAGRATSRPRLTVEADIAAAVASPASALPPSAAAPAPAPSVLSRPVAPSSAVLSSSLPALTPSPANAREATRQPRPTPEKIVRKPTSPPPLDADRTSPGGERRHVKLDRSAVLNPFE